MAYGKKCNSESWANLSVFKKAFLGLLAGIFIIIVIHGVNCFVYGKSIKYENITVRSAKISPELSGFKIAFITDTHSISDAAVRGVVAELNRRNIDLVLLGGDYATYHKTAELMKILSDIKTTHGIYGVVGNHDGPKNTARAMQKNGVALLENDGRKIYKNLFLAGVEDLWTGKPDVAKSVHSAGKNDFVLLIAHNPDIAMTYDVSRADLTISGHTHGGQVTFFGLWAPALTLRKNITDYGQKFMGGFTKSAAGTDVYVSRGTGQLKEWPRVFARPEVTIFKLMNRE